MDTNINELKSNETANVESKFSIFAMSFVFVCFVLGFVFEHFFVLYLYFLCLLLLMIAII